MASITWLGEDDLHGDGNGPRFNTWNGVKFEIGKAVDIDDERMIAKARNNRFYSVDGAEPKRGPGRPKKEEAKAPEPKVSDLLKAPEPPKVSETKSSEGPAG